MSNGKALVGIDAGGTKVSGLVLADGEILDTYRLETDDSSQEAVVAASSGSSPSSPGAPLPAAWR